MGNSRRRSATLALVLVSTMAVGYASEQTERPATSWNRAADSRLSDAFAALYAGDSNRALQLASGYLKQHPLEVKALVLAAQAHLARGESDAAYDLLQRALSLDARNVDVLYFLGVVSSHMATREFERLFALAPDGPRVHQLLARSFKVQDKLVEAAAEYELALRANPNLVDALLEFAEIRREESNCDEAAGLYERAESIRPTFESAYGLGVCLATRNDHARAMDAFRKALKRDPQSAVAHFGLGSSLLQSADTAAAVTALERAVALEPRMRQAYYLLGRAYRAMGLRERSQQAFARAETLAQAERTGDQNKLGRPAPAKRMPVRPKTPR